MPSENRILFSKGGVNLKAVSVRVEGLVQGVFFRAETVKTARQNGVAGWVRNNDDGSVEAHLEGADSDVERVVEWCKAGPPRAVVKSVSVEGVESEGHRGFSVRYV